MSRLVYICRVKSTNVAPNRGDSLILSSDFIAFADISARSLGGLSAIHRLTGDLVHLRTFFGREPWFLLGQSNPIQIRPPHWPKGGAHKGRPYRSQAAFRGVVRIRLVRPGLSGPAGLFFFNLVVRSTDERRFGYCQYITHLMKISSDFCGNLLISLSAQPAKMLRSVMYSLCFSRDEFSLVAASPLFENMTIL